ncbi:MAG: bacteriophage abortive infection AbiH family protein [Acholeplasmatales bacterium]|nr:bacteriophage abortive infection AbiH family protein [Acholeplasmatales bacterium]
MNDDTYDDIEDNIRAKNEGVKLVLGNGFDLYCGLKTRYIDFFNAEKSKYEQIKKWCEGFRILPYTHNIGNNNWVNWDSYNKLSEECNVWDIYFAIVVGENDYNWCDIETEMLTTLNGQNKVLKWKDVMDIALNITATWTENRGLAYRIAFYIVEKNYDISTEEKYYSFLLNELKKFEKRFGEFVNNELILKHDEYLRQSSHLFEIVESINHITSVETFNYVDDRDIRNVEHIKHSDIVTHINGDYKNPIFGIDSSRIDVSSQMFIFTKVARRLLNSTLDGGLNYVSLDENYDCLAIFGHSLCEHDYNYFFPIFDYLDVTNVMKRSCIFFFYYIYNESEREKIILDNIRSVTRLIDAYEKYAGKNRSNRLLDSLTIQGRIIFEEIKK